jgi:hypothetical protein
MAELQISLSAKAASAPKVPKSKQFDPIMPAVVKAGAVDIEVSKKGKSGPILFFSIGEADCSIVPVTGGYKYVVSAVYQEASIESADIGCITPADVTAALEVVSKTHVFLSDGVYLAEPGTVFRTDMDPIHLAHGLKGKSTVYIAKPEDADTSFYFTKRPQELSTDGQMDPGSMIPINKPGILIAALEG